MCSIINILYTPHKLRKAKALSGKEASHNKGLSRNRERVLNRVITLKVGINVYFVFSFFKN